MNRPVDRNAHKSFRLLGMSAELTPGSGGHSVEAVQFTVALNGDRFTIEMKAQSLSPVNLSIADYRSIIKQIAQSDGHFPKG